MKHNLVLPVAVLTILLVLSFAVLKLNQRETISNPSADNRGPSGTLVAAALLRSQGFDVRIERNPKPRIREDEAAIAFFVWSYDSFLEEDTLNEEATRKPLFDQVRKGGRLLEIFVEEDFAVASKEAQKATSVVTSENAHVTYKASLSGDFFYSDQKTALITSDEMDNGLTLWGYKNEDFSWIEAYGVGKGKLITACNGIAFTNQFIDKNDNAGIFLGLVQAISPSRKVVFVEATVGETVQPSLVSVLGPGATYAWWQALILFGVAVYAFGRPFGRRIAERRKQRAARNLADALADTTLRGHNTVFAVETLAELAKRKAMGSAEEPTEPPIPGPDGIDPEEAVRWARRLEGRPKRGKGA